MEHSAAERHVGAVTEYFQETPEDLSLQALFPPVPCSARAVTAISDTIIDLFFTYLLTNLVTYLLTYLLENLTFCEKKTWRYCMLGAVVVSSSHAGSSASEIRVDGRQTTSPRSTMVPRRHRTRVCRPDHEHVGTC